MEYYVFATKTEADDCISAINDTNWFPIVGMVNGVPAPNNQQTTKWIDAPTELLTGEWAIPRIPESRLNHLNVPQEDRDAFLAVYGQDIRDLDGSEFVQIEESI